MRKTDQLEETAVYSSVDDDIIHLIQMQNSLREGLCVAMQRSNRQLLITEIM